MYLTNSNKGKVKEIQEFRDKIFPRYYKIVKELDKHHNKQLLHHVIENHNK